MPKRRKDDLTEGPTGIGTLIKAARRKIGITQSELAERLGISHQQISKYERNADDISAVRLWHIARVLTTPVELLYPSLEGGLAEADQERYRAGGDNDDLNSLVSRLRDTVTALEKAVRPL